MPSSHDGSGSGVSPRVGRGRVRAARLALAMLMASGTAAPVFASEPPERSFERFADSLMTAQIAGWHIPGAVLAVVRDGRVAFARGYGFANLERRIPVDAERTMFRVASVSKPFTATAALQLVEAGRLGLHDDVNRVLRHFQVPSTLARPVTLFDLLTHTAGFDESNLARKAYRPEDVPPLSDYLARRLPARIRAPGDCIAYSNHGMALAGYLVEVAAGTPFERYMNERVFVPLGMSHSTFELVPDSLELLAMGYDGEPARRVAADYTSTRPASMLSTSGSDVAHFMIAQLDGGRYEGARVLDDSSVAMMQRRQFTQAPALAGVGFGLWERFQNGERGLWHDGDAAGFASLLYLVPQRHVGYFMAFNSRAGNRARREILAALLDRDFPHTLSPPRPASPDVAASVASRLAGTYVDARHAHRTLEKLASLARVVTLRRNADGSLELTGTRYVPVSADLLRAADGEGSLAFRTDHAGRVTHLFESRSISRTLERVPWHGTLAFQFAWLIACGSVFLWNALLAVVGVFSRRRRAFSSQGRGGAVRWVPGLLSLGSCLNLAFLVGLGFAIAGSFGSLEYGIPVVLRVLLAVPLLTTSLAIASLFAFPNAWKGSQRSGRRARLAITMVAVLAFVPWLAYWNLMGYRF